MRYPPVARSWPQGLGRGSSGPRIARADAKTARMFAACSGLRGGALSTLRRAFSTMAGPSKVSAQVRQNGLVMLRERSARATVAV